jgi:proteasome lid subunit RPN8/RPN11
MKINFNLNVIMKERFKKIIDYFSINYEKEIAGFIVGEIKENDVILKGLLFPSQSVSVGSVEFKPASLRKQKGDECLNIIGQFHSHNSMGCFWSSTDEDETIKPFMKTHDLGVFIVSSKGKDLIRIDLKKPIDISIDDIKPSIEFENKGEIEEECKQIIKDCIIEGSSYSSFDDDENPSIFLDTEPHEEKKPSNNKIKKLLRQHLILNNNMIIINNLSWLLSNILFEDLKKFNVKTTFDRGDKNSASLEIFFKDNRQAGKHFKEIKEILKNALLEEIELLTIN